MSDAVIFTALAENAGDRIDKFISEKSESLSRSAAAKIIEEQGVTVNGSVVSKNYKCKENDKIVLIVPQAKPLDVEAENIPLDIVYEDNDLLVVNKPKGMVVHPAPGNYSGTLVNALLYHCRNSLSGINGVLRPGIVHRIDKDTSGLLIVAKNDTAHAGLARQIKEHSFSREYECVVHGNIKDDEGTIHVPIGRNPKDRKKMAVINDGTAREAVTHYEVLERFSGVTHLALRLETGRTHQIRVHMSYKGHALLGDPV